MISDWYHNSPVGVVSVWYNPILTYDTLLSVHYHIEPLYRTSTLLDFVQYVWYRATQVDMENLD